MKISLNGRIGIVKINILFLRHFRKNDFLRSLTEYLACKKHLKNKVKRKKINLKRINKQKLINSRKCPKQFWKNIKGNTSRRNVTDKIAPNEWFEYFEQLLCPQNYDDNGNENLLAEIRQNNDASEMSVLIKEDEVRQGIVIINLLGQTVCLQNFSNVQLNILFFT